MDKVLAVAEMLQAVTPGLLCGRRFMDAELQQRAVEYLGLERRPDVAQRNVVGMPPWEKRKSLLLRRMADREVQPIALQLVGTPLLASFAYAPCCIHPTPTQEVMRCRACLALLHLPHG